MPLIDLKTNLKDLKFGHDEYEGASSNQPYIQTRIPATDEPLQTGISISGDNLLQTLGSTALSAGAGAAVGAIGGSLLGSTGTGTIIGAAAGLGLGIAGNAIQGNSVSLRTPTAGTGGPDFLVRGGTLLPNILINDTVRLSKYFASTEGILFTVKQNLLSRIGTRAQGTTGLLNERLYTPISSLLGAVGTPFGLHVNKQGLNPLLGVGDPYTPDRYFTAIKNELNEDKNNTNSFSPNRLIRLTNSKIYDIVSYNSSTLGISSNSEFLFSYQGGPGSFLGIGKTNIAYATDNTGAPLSVGNTKTYSEYDSLVGYVTLNLPLIYLASNVTGDNKNPTAIDFRKRLREGLDTSTILSNAPSYIEGKNKTIEQRVNLGNPGKLNKNVISYTQGYAPGANGAASPNSFDRINSSKIYTTTLDTPNNNDPGLTDLVQFRIGVINNDTPSYINYINFRAFLNQITDTFTSNWDQSKYIGRGENFYTYSGFDRKYSLSWTVAAQSKAELIPMYRKLNYLASLCAPDYSDAGYMRGNIIRLTVGGYFYEQPGILRGFSYEMNDDNSTWEIGIDDSGGLDSSVRELPHLIKVSSFEFTPIHEFVPKKQRIDFNPDTGIAIGYGQERYIALEDRTGDLYTSERLPNVERAPTPQTTSVPEGSNDIPLRTLPPPQPVTPPAPPLENKPTVTPPPAPPLLPARYNLASPDATRVARPFNPLEVERQFSGFTIGQSGGGGAGDGW